MSKYKVDFEIEDIKVSVVVSVGDYIFKNQMDTAASLARGRLFRNPENRDYKITRVHEVSQDATDFLDKYAFRMDVLAEQEVNLRLVDENLEYGSLQDIQENKSLRIIDRESGIEVHTIEDLESADDVSIFLQAIRWINEQQ